MDNRFFRRKRRKVAPPKRKMDFELIKLYKKRDQLALQISNNIIKKIDFTNVEESKRDFTISMSRSYSRIYLRRKGLQETYTPETINFVEERVLDKLAPTAIKFGAKISNYIPKPRIRTYINTPSKPIEIQKPDAPKPKKRKK